MSNRKGEANSAKIAEIRARAEAQRCYQEVEELNDWPVDDVLALVEVAEAAQAYVVVGVLDPEWRAKRARLTEALQKVYLEGV